ncbi:MAG: class I SAM-dependent methyltransferase [Planctomycetota bacterium]|nr:class I SAM-dependent methyltransferase [Planctomycetota bacterium]
MGSPREAQEYDAMDHSSANASFVDALVAHGCVRGDVLDLGTGPGHIPLLLVERCPGVQVTATDLSEEMLKVARLKVADAGHSDSIRLMPSDAKQLPFADGQFDGVFSNTILHHVADPVAYFAEAARVLKSGGALVIRDLVRPPDTAQAQAIVDTYAASETEYARKLFYDSLLAAYTMDEVRALLDMAGVSSAQVAATSDRHLTVWIDSL